MNRRSLTALAVLPPLLAFATLMLLAMSEYPGGTWEEHDAVGHSQVRNFLCDLTRPIAINGQANALGARYAELGLYAYVIALGPFFLITPWLFADKRRLGRVVWICGALCSLGGIAIVALPSWMIGPLMHGVLVLTTAVPGLIAALGATLGAWTTSTPRREIRFAAAATLVATAVTVAVFARQIARGEETTTGLPVLEKAAISLSMVWMALTVLAVMKRAAAPSVTLASSNVDLTSKR
jgi:hypothetical protein